MLELIRTKPLFSRRIFWDVDFELIGFDGKALSLLTVIMALHVFKVMQCEGREWIGLFSPEYIEQFDSIFTDAMTFTDHKGRRMRLWIPEEVYVEDEELIRNNKKNSKSCLNTLQVNIFLNFT